MGEVIGFHRHGQVGYHSLADLPQRPSIEGTSLSTGWPELDEIWRLYPGQFNIVTGIAGHGKSTFILNVLCNLAKVHGVRSFLHVPENEGHVRRKLEGIWGAASGFKQFCEEQCFIQSATPDEYDSVPKTLDWVLDRAIVGIERDGIDVLLIDPWNELERAKPKEMLLTDYIGQCLMWLKQFCRRYSVAVILIAHPTKAGLADGKVPTLSDIEGSLAWHNKCDNGLIIHREADKPACKVISAKVREHGAGARGTCHFSVDPKTGIFTPNPGGVYVAG